MYKETESFNSRIAVSTSHVVILYPKFASVYTVSDRDLIHVKNIEGKWKKCIVCEDDGVDTIALLISGGNIKKCQPVSLYDDLKYDTLYFIERENDAVGYQFIQVSISPTDKSKFNVKVMFVGFDANYEVY